MDEREQQRKVRHRLAILRHVEEVTGDVSAICRYYGISRPTFYKWLHRFEDLGEEGLRDRSSAHHRCPTATPTEIVGKVLYLRQSYHFGPRKISMYLQRYHDITISPSVDSGTIASHNRSASGSRSGGLSGAATTGLGKSRLRPSSFNTCNRRSGTGPREPTSTDRRPTSGNKKSFGVSSVEPHPAIKLVRGCLRPPARSHVDGLRMIAKPPPRADESVRVRADRRTPLGTRGPMPCRSDRTWRTPGTGHHRST